MNSQTILKIFCSHILLCSAFARADFELGMQYCLNKEFEKAYVEFTLSAELGDVESQYNVGVMQYRGDYAAKDLVSAYAWLKLAQSNKSELATKTMALVESKMSAQQKQLGERAYLTLGERLSTANIQKRLAQIAPIGTGEFTKPKELKSKATTISESRRMKLGEFNIELSYTVATDGSVRDISIEKDEPAYTMAFVKSLRQTQFAPATHRGKPISAYGEKSQIRISTTMEGEKLNTEKLIMRLNSSKQKAEQGDGASIFAYAYQTEFARSFYENKMREANQDLKFDDPNTWYLKSAQAGFSLGEYKIGSNMLAGHQCDANPAQGLAWLERSASRGILDAQFLLGAEYYSGEKVPRDTTKGLYWLERASAGHYNNASIKLAWIYATSPDDRIRNRQKSLEHLKAVPDTHLDELSFWETSAAVFALNDDFKAAIKAQKKAMSTAKDYGLELPKQAQQLFNYEAKKIWLEPI